MRCTTHTTKIAYAYLDGELHVKVSLAMDAIIRDLTKHRKVLKTVLCLRLFPAIYTHVHTYTHTPKQPSNTLRRPPRTCARPRTCT